MSCIVYGFATHFLVHTWFAGYVNWVGNTGSWVTVNTVGGTDVCAN